MKTDATKEPIAVMLKMSAPSAAEHPTAATIDAIKMMMIE